MTDNTCPACHSPINPSDDSCPNCGTYFGSGSSYETKANQESPYYSTIRKTPLPNTSYSSADNRPMSNSPTGARVKYCPNCGSQMKAGAKFCGACGQTIDAEVATDALPIEDLSLFGYFCNCLEGKNYTKFSGRARRKEYWGFFLFDFIMTLVIPLVSWILLLRAIMIDGGNSPFAKVPNILGWLWYLYIFFPSLAVMIRRLHDIGKSGWNIIWLRLPTIVFMGFVVLMEIGTISETYILNIFNESAGCIIVGISIVMCLIIAIIELVWFCTKGNKGGNKYGPDPKGRL